MRHTITLRPFTVPNYALPEREDSVGDPLKPIPLQELSSDALDELCTRFRMDVFKKAGKVDPKSELSGLAELAQRVVKP
jgi:hypothetical protein